MPYFWIMFPDLLGVALHRWKIMFIEIIATFVCVDMTLKLKHYSARTAPKGNRSQNLGCVDDWYKFENQAHL